MNAAMQRYAGPDAILWSDEPEESCWTLEELDGSADTGSVRAAWIGTCAGFCDDAHDRHA